MTRSGKDSNEAKKIPGRSQRLAKELRENLRKRKAQERGRAGSPVSEGPIKAGSASRNGRVP